MLLLEFKGTAGGGEGRATDACHFGWSQLQFCKKLAIQQPEITEILEGQF